MKKILVAVLMLTIICISISAQGQAKAGDSVVRMRVGDIENVQNLGAIALDKFAEEIKERSEGKIEVQAFHASQLGSATKQLELVQSGALEAYRGALSWLTGYDSGFTLIEFPYLAGSIEEAKMIAQSDAMQALNEKLAENFGIRYVTAGWVRLPRQIITVRPVTHVSHMDRLKIRVPEIFAYVESFRALGASPTPVAFGETYLALRQGIVEGAENHVESLYNMKWYESAKHLSLTNHVYSITGFIVNDKWWQTLTKEQQQLIIEVHDEIDIWFESENEKLQQFYIDKMVAEGVTVHTVDSDSFREKVMPAVLLKAEDAGEWEKGLYSQIEALLK